MNDIAQTNLAEPAKVDWENYGKSSYVPPPPALDANGKPIVYTGVPVSVTLDEPDDFGDGGPFLQFKLDPIKITSPAEYAGYEIRFTQASTSPYTIQQSDGTRVPKKGNPNKLADYLRATGAQAKPQTNSEYVATVNLVKNKPVQFTIDWEARSKDTGEKVKGFLAFPPDDLRPGQRKSILKSGDGYSVVDYKGNVTGAGIVKAEVLFANARLRYFVDPKKAK